MPTSCPVWPFPYRLTDTWSYISVFGGCRSLGQRVSAQQWWGSSGKPPVQSKQCLLKALVLDMSSIQQCVSTVTVLVGEDGQGNRQVQGESRFQPSGLIDNARDKAEIGSSCWSWERSITHVQLLFAVASGCGRAYLVFPLCLQRSTWLSLFWKHGGEIAEEQKVLR